MCIFFSFFLFFRLSKAMNVFLSYFLNLFKIFFVPVIITF